MQPKVDVQNKDAKPAVKLNRIVTPAHIKIMSASMAPVAPPKSAVIPDLVVQDAEEPGTPAAEVASEGMTSLKKLGITATCLTVLIVVLLIPWPQSSSVENATLTNSINAPEPNPILTISSLVAPLSGGANLNAVTRPGVEIVPQPSATPSIATIPEVERAPVVGKPAAGLTVAPVEVVEAVDLVDVPGGVAVEIADAELEIEAPFIQEVEVVSAPVVIEPTNEPRDFVQEMTFSAIAALRNGSSPPTTPPSVSPEDSAVFQFVRDARAAGRTEVAVDALINAAYQTKNLNVPAHFLLSDGRVNSVAIFAAMRGIK